MSGLPALVAAAITVLAAAYLPGFAAVRLLGGSRWLALALAPALGAAVAGTAAIAAPLVGLRWSLLPFLLGAAVLLAVALGLRRLDVQLPATVLDGPLGPRPTVPFAGAWIAAAAGVAIAPIVYQAGRADAVLERWDTLYHLSALQRIRETGTASSLDLGSVSNSAGDPTPYPAGFHALASLVPGVEVPILLNGAVLALATVPWVLGIGVVARSLHPQAPWAPFAAAVVATLIPASPLNLWIHLSPIPNLIGSAVLPGALAGAASLWGALLPRWVARAPDRPSGGGPVLRPGLAALGVVGIAGLGMGVLHPNVAVTALILLTVLTAVTCAPHWRRRPWLIALPVATMAPVALLSYTPLGAAVTGFSGGLQVPWWTALGEVVLGLLTVWPMALGVVLAVLWWPGLVSSFRGSARWVGPAWIVLAVLYLDAALDSPLNLSALYYRGQDRIAMPLAMLSAVLVVPGLQAWARTLGPAGPTGRRHGARRPLLTALVVLGVIAALTSVPPRLDNAAKNLAEDYPGRGRFLQADERALFERYVPQMDQSGTVLASPFSGAAHLYALFGQDVRLPVAGMAYSDLDRDLLYAVGEAATDQQACALLEDNGIRYVYQEHRPYQFHRTSDSVNRGTEGLGRVLFETDHSRMIEIDCGTGTADDA